MECYTNVQILSMIVALFLSGFSIGVSVTMLMR